MIDIRDNMTMAVETHKGCLCDANLDGKAFMITERISVQEILVD